VTAEASSIARATELDGGMQPESLLAWMVTMKPPQALLSDADIVAM